MVKKKSNLNCVVIDGLRYIFTDKELNRAFIRAKLISGLD